MFSNIKTYYVSLLDERTQLEVILGEAEHSVPKFENVNGVKDDGEPVDLMEKYILPETKMEMVKPPVPEGYDSDEFAPDFLFVDAYCPFDGLFTPTLFLSFYSCSRFSLFFFF